MDASFWKGRWRRAEIGWHASSVNPHLKRYWAEVMPSCHGRILVPLCGKTLDLKWLAERGHEVVGVELSELACEQFFTEQGLVPKRSTVGAFTSFEAGTIRILCGDIFQLRREDVGEIAGWYDRAALIALSPEQRQAYARILAAVLPLNANGLVIGLAYSSTEKKGPPFSVPETEIAEGWGEDFAWDILARADIVDDEPRFRASWGLTALIQTFYALRRR